MNPLDNPAFVIFAAISPLLIALLKQQGFSRQVNALIALAAYVVVGVLGAILSGQALTVENAVALIATATLVGQAAYAIVWNNLGTGSDGTQPSLDARIRDATSLVRSTTFP